jgi:hypothetical protein
MKKKVLRCIIAQFTFQLLLISLINAQDNQFKKNYDKVYDVNENTSLEINNEYGDVDIKGWDKASISIGVEVKAIVSKEKKAQEILDNIDVVFSESGGTIRVESTIGKEFRNVFKFWNGDKRKFEINYTVFMPATVPLNLFDKYGSVFIDELSSTSNIEVRYGTLKANRIIHNDEKPLTRIILAYSDGEIEDCKYSKIDIKYSKLQVSASKALVIISKYSKINIDEGTSIVSNSKYDTYRIDKLQNFIIETAYTNFKISEINNKLQSDSKYSSFKIDYMPAGFEKIGINSKYSNYKIGMDKDASYSIEGYAKYGDINYPDNAEVDAIKDKKELKVKGFVGSDRNSGSAVSINTSYGTIKLVD